MYLHHHLTWSTKGKLYLGVKGDKGAVAETLVCLACDQ